MPRGAGWVEPLGGGVVRGRGGAGAGALGLGGGRGHRLSRCTWGWARGGGCWPCLPAHNHHKASIGQLLCSAPASDPAPRPCPCPASGIVDAYWEYRLKPWDVAAGVLIVEEAGGRVTTMDGLAYSVFQRSMLATNDALYSQVRLRRPRAKRGRAVRLVGVLCALCCGSQRASPA